MTALSALGLVGALALYVGVVYLISWSSHREVAASTQGTDVDSTAFRAPSAAEIARRQNLAWVAFLVAIFVLLNLIGVPFWQRLVFAAVFAGFFASVWLLRAKEKSPDPVPPSVRFKARVGYRWLLVWLDGFSFMALLCFAIELIWRLAG